MNKVVLNRILGRLLRLSVSGIPQLLFVYLVAQPVSAGSIGVSDIGETEELLDGEEPRIGRERGQYESIMQSILNSTSNGNGTRSIQIGSNSPLEQLAQKNNDDNPVLVQQVLNAEPLKSPEYVALMAQAQTLKKELKALVRRAKFPHTAGFSSGGIPSVDEVEIAEKKFREEFATKLTKYFLNLSAADDNLSPSVLESARRLLANYSALMTNYVVLRAYSFMNMDRETQFSTWIKYMGIQVPRNIMRSVPCFYFFGVDRTHVNMEYPLLQVDWQNVDKLDSVKVFLSYFSVEEIELMAAFATSKTKEEALFRVVQAMSVRQLLSSADELNYYVTDPKVKLTPIPNLKIAKIDSLKRWDLVREENEGLFLNPLLIRRMLKLYRQRADEMPAFGDSEYYHRLAEALKDNTRAVQISLTQQEDFSILLGRVMDNQVSEYFMQALKVLLERSRYRLSSLEPQQLNRLFKESIAAAYAFVHASVLDQQFNLGVVRYETKEEEATLAKTPEQKAEASRLNAAEVARRRAVEGIITAQYHSYLEKFSDASSRLTDVSMVSEATELKRQRRDGFLQELSLASQDIVNANKADEVDLGALVQVLLPSLSGLQLNGLTTSKYLQEMIAQSMNKYENARERFAMSLARIVGKDRADVNVLDYFAKFDPNLKSEKAGSDQFIANYEELQQRKDLNDWLAVGLLFRFDQDFKTTRHRVQASDILENYTTRALLVIPVKHNLLDEYFAHLGNNQITRYPLLKMDVVSQGKTKSLYQAIADKGLTGIDAKMLEREIGPEVNEAIEKLSAQIAKNLVDIANVQSSNPTDLVDVMKGSELRGQLEKVFKPAEPLLASFLEKTGYAKPVDYLFRNPNKTFQEKVGTLFQLSLYFLAAQIVMNRLPGGGYALGRMTRAAAGGLNRYISPFFYASLYLTGAKIAEGYWQKNEDSQHLQNVKQLFMSSARGSLFYDYRSVVGQEQIIKAKTSEMRIELAMTSLFMGIPAYFKFKVIPEGFKRVKYMRDRENQEILGIPNVWSVQAVEEAYAMQARLRPYASVTLDKARQELLTRMTTANHKLLGLVPSEGPEAADQILAALNKQVMLHPLSRNLYARAANELLKDLKTIQALKGSGGSAVGFTNPWAPWRAEVLQGAQMSGNTVMMNAEERAIWNETKRAHEKIQELGKMPRDAKL